MPFEIATANDLTRLAELLAEPSGVSNVTRGLAHIFAHPGEGAILIARGEGGRVIAVAVLTRTVSTAAGGYVLVLTAFRVDPAFQRRGVGSRLLGEALEYARAQGFLRITLWSETLDESARRFFRKRGFADSEMISLSRLL